MDVLTDVRLLFADDDPDVLGMMKFMTDQSGWRGDYVSSAIQLINTVNINCISGKTCYDIIVADVNYIHQNDEVSLTGITAAREIRKVRPEIPILFVSGYVNSIIREEVRRIGDAMILAKPLDPMELFLRIEKLVRWYRLTNRKGFVGIERRRNSVNRSLNMRRSTDRLVSVPEHLEKLISEVQQIGRAKDA